MAGKKENPIVSLVLNIVIPVFILTKFSKAEYLGPLNGLLVALAFPLGYGIYGFVQEKKLNFISLLGFLSVLLTGVFSLFELDPFWIAVKEAAVPAVIGIVISISVFFREPLIKKILLNDQLFRTDVLYLKLSENSENARFEETLRQSSHWLAASFALSAVLNFVLARIIVVSNPGTEKYNEEIGTLTALSFPVIAVPCTILMLWILWRILVKIKLLTGLELDELLKK